MRLAVINADDFGLIEAVNKAILAAHRAGSVTSATLMPNGRAVESAVRIALGEPALGVGLHFTLTYGRPVAPPGRSLVDGSGRFVSRRELLRRSLTGALRREEIDRELRAQLKQLRDLGVEVTHLDGHQHIQVVPVVASAVADVANEEELRVRVPLVQWGQSLRLARLPQRLSLAVLNALAMRVGLRPATAAFTSVFDLATRRVDPSAYIALVRRSAAATLELMVHPSLPSPDLAKIHPDLYDTAVAEGAALSDPSLAASLAAEGVRLVNFRDLT